MKTFQIEDTQACWVTFTHIVEAENETEARTKYYNGESQETSNDIGDTLDGYGENITVQEVQS